MKLFFAILFAALVLFAPSYTLAKEELVDASLIADATAIAAGQPFTVGVKLHIAPTWHVYWINPGDTGIATELTFQLPDGFSAGPVQFPVPHAFDIGGGTMAYGYTDEVMLLATITPPANLKPGQDVNITAKTGWLVCTSQNCVKGDATKSLQLKTADKSAPANTAEFDKWRDTLPRGDGKIQQKIKVDAPGGEFKAAKVTLTADLEKGAKNPEFFPAPPDSLVVTDIACKMDGLHAIVTFNVQPLAGQKISDPSISSVLAYTVDGKRTGLTVPIKLTASKSFNDS